MHPLETSIVGIACLFAIVRGVGRGALDRREVDPFLAAVGFIGLICRRGCILDVEGEVIPILAEGKEGGLYEIVENVNEEEGFL